MSLNKLLLDRNKRLYLCKKSLFLFAVYYFRHYFTHKSAWFHFEMAKNFDLLQQGEKRFHVLCWFRDSGKTSFAKIDFIRQIVFGTRKMMFYCCYDETKSENALFDIALELQTNKYILEDFGQLYFNEQKAKQSKKSKIGNFLTANDVRVQATSVKKAIRWEVFWGKRPDYFVMDDFENKETKNSYAKTRQVIDYINEMIPWLSTDWCCTFLCNRISDNGSVQHLFDTFWDNEDAIAYERSLIDDFGEIVWKDKFVHTNAQMARKNKSRKENKVISIESLKNALDTEMPWTFAQEYLNQPLVEGERFFDLQLIDKAKKTVGEFEVDWNWKIWKKFESLNSYRIALDVASWTWLDNTVIQVINVTTSEQVAEWVSDLIPPEKVVDELIQASDNYWECVICPENNGVGLSIISLIKDRGYWHLLPVETTIDKIKGIRVNKYGWSTNSKTKPKMLYDLKRDFEKGELKINSVELLKEMQGFSNFEIEHRWFNVRDMAQKHFDRVMAIAICNQLRLRADQWMYMPQRANVKVKTLNKAIF